MGLDGERYPLDLGVPGQFNRANAVMAAVAASYLGDTSGHELAIGEAIRGLARVDQVAGRYSSTVWKGHPVRLLLAKNPAGWTAIFDLLDELGSPDSPVVLSVNARIADGLDTSWLWDVPFERLVGSTVVATGDRRRDLAVRLQYAEVDHHVSPDPLAALDRAAALGSTGGPVGPAPITFLGNYTAFSDLRARL